MTPPTAQVAASRAVNDLPGWLYPPAWVVMQAGTRPPYAESTGTGTGTGLVLRGGRAYPIRWSAAP